MEDLGFSYSSLYSRLELRTVLKHHTGCVNAVYWNDTGDLISSGSDDTRLCLWSYPECSLVASIPTDHSANIFSTRFLPHSGCASERIVTTAGDAEVRVFTAAKERLVLDRVFGCHRQRVKKSDVVPDSPHLFWTASEDGTIRRFDLRESHSSCSAEGCPNAVINAQEWDLGFESISISPLRPEYFVVGGNETVARVFDQRSLSSNSPSANFDRAACFWTPSSGESDLITSAKFSNASMDIVASFLDDRIYVIDPFDQSGRHSGLDSTYSIILEQMRRKRYEESIQPWTQLIRQHRRNLRAPGWRRLIALEYLNRALCYLTRTLPDILSAAEDLRKCRDLLEPGDAYEELALTLLAVCVCLIGHCEEALQMVSEYGDDSSTLLGGLRQSMIYERQRPDVLLYWMAQLEPASISSERLPKGTVTNYGEIYSGHVNIQTVKDVNFLGPSSDFVISGSDNGYFMIWSRKTGKIIFMAKSDHHIVNCIQGHPTLPVVAASGIDDTIKIWEPVSKPPLSKEREEAVGENYSEDYYRVPPQDYDRVIQSSSYFRVGLVYSEPLQCPVQ